MKKWFTILTILPFLMFAQTKGFKPVQQQANEQRIALVIGNSKYASAPLRNPENDAKDIAQALRNANFRVLEYTNLNQNEMKKAIATWGEQLNSNAVALFYYSGHGVQIAGNNYLIPIGAKINKEQDVDLEAVDARRVLAEMEGARSRLNIVVLDACRDNPLPKTVRNASRGLAQMNAPVGTLIAYSTSPGSVASDGSGRNGLYTGMLLQYLNAPGLKIEDVFKNVRTAVRQQSGGAQITWESNSIEGDFYFTGGTSTFANATSPQPTKLQTDKKKSSDGFSLDDIDKEIEAKKAEEKRVATEREEKLQTMRDAFNKVQAVLSENVSSEKKKFAKERFLQFFAANLDWTNEDEAMRRRLTFTLDMDFIFVQGGTFQMGSNDYENEKPIHSVTVSDFNIGKYEVTQKQWQAVMGTNPSNFKGENLPVEQVSWNDIQQFIAKLNELSGETYRLPTEAEWEYAARGGNRNSGNKFSGSNDINSVAWYSSNSGSASHQVGTKQPNELGIYDMSGNVWEWCNDWYDENYYSSSPTQNPQGASSGANRVLRGGSWINYGLGNYCRVALRLGNTPVGRSILGGFRLLRTK